MSGMKSKRKGARGEREAAKKLNQILGLDDVYIRGQQFCGLRGDADICVDPEDKSEAGYILDHLLHFECKYVEKFQLYPSLEQAEADKHQGKIPLVMHRRNGKPWTLVLYAEHLPLLAQAVEAARKTGEENKET